jgi:hypothetical protein
MATYYARKAGNINASDVWATTPSGTASNLFPTFTNADVLVANSFTITINVNTTVAEVRNDSTGGATSGGLFSLSSGVNLKANVIGGVGGNTCVSVSGNASIEGNLTVSVSGFASSGRTSAVIFTGTPGTTLTITGNIISPAILQHVRVLDFQGAGGQLNITGNLVGNATSGNYSIPLSTSSPANTGSISISGNITAGNYSGLDNLSSNVPVSVTGTVTGGNTGVFGISNTSTSTCTIGGSAVGGVGGAGVSNSSTGTIRVTRAVGNAYGPGNTAGIAAAVGAANVGLGVIEIEQLEYGTNGMSPTSGTGIRLKKASSNVAIFNYCDTAGAKTLIDATQNAAMPAANHVRSGVSYASGALTGSCAVPAASSVAFGVPVDNTTGTAVLDPAAVASAVWGAATRTLTTSSGPTAADNATAVWGAATRTLTAGAGITAADVWSHSSRTVTGGTVDTLTNAPTVPTAAAIATQVRSELSVELGRVDQAISSRATAGDIPTESEIAAEVWAKPTTELTITGSIGERAKNQSTVSTTGAQLAAALS